MVKNSRPGSYNKLLTVAVAFGSLVRLMHDSYKSPVTNSTRHTDIHHLSSVALSANQDGTHFSTCRCRESLGIRRRRPRQLPLQMDSTVPAVQWVVCSLCGRLPQLDANAISNSGLCLRFLVELCKEGQRTSCKLLHHHVALGTTG
jgi:hypothetical protein